MRNIKLTIRYDGTAYAGWQSQLNGVAIQDVIQGCVKKITGQSVSLIASGRTDAGVHAEAQTANFKIKSSMPLKKIQSALNSRLPDDIAITRVEEAAIGFNARKCAKSKVYRYTIYNKDYMDPLIRRYAAKCFFRLDAALMRKASGYLIGKRDFKSFQTTDRENKKSVRTIKRISIKRVGDLISIVIEADGFLYNMVRTIAGTLVEVGRGKIMADSVRSIIIKKNRKFSGPTMPARGLCLVKVKYGYNG